MKYERLVQIISGFNEQSYSGRGMHGRKCLAVVTDSETTFELLAGIIENCDNEEEAADLVRRAKTDSMGLETVIYWPSIRIPE